MNERINDRPAGDGRHWSVEDAADRLGTSAGMLSQLIASGAVKADHRGPLGTRIPDSEIIRLRNRGARPPQRSQTCVRVPGLSERESAVMVALWTAAGPLTINDFPRTGPVPVAANTAFRILERLLAAGLVSRIRREQPRPAWLYSAAQSPADYAASLARQVHDAVSQAGTSAVSGDAPS